MSIILKEIDMPKGQSLMVFIANNGAVTCSGEDGVTTAQAIQIPTPHGRLIDETEVKKNSIDDDYDLYVSWTEIDKTPTILEAEE